MTYEFNLDEKNLTNANQNIQDFSSSIFEKSKINILIEN